MAPHLQDAEDFWVRVSNAAGHADSQSATATPGPPLDARLLAAGANFYGQLGTGNTTSQLVAVQIAAGVTEVAAGSSHSAFITADGVLRAMGSNSSGQLDVGTIAQRNSPVTIAQHVVAVAAGGSHTLFRDLRPAILQQPLDVNTGAGATPTLTVAASGQGPFSYQWYRGASGDTTLPLGGAVSTSFTVPPLAETASWWVRVTTALGTADSRSAEVLLVTPPEIAIQPSAATVETGALAALRAAANGDAIQWQWYRDASGDISQPIAGANGPLLVTPPLHAIAPGPRNEMKMNEVVLLLMNLERQLEI